MFVRSRRTVSQAKSTPNYRKDSGPQSLKEALKRLVLKLHLHSKPTVFYFCFILFCFEIVVASYVRKHREIHASITHFPLMETS